MKLGVKAGSTLLVLLCASPASAIEPAIRCEADKVKVAGKYHFCRMKAESRAIKKDTDPTEALAKCDQKYGIKWPKIETKGGGACPTNGDEDSMQSRLTGQVDDVTTLLSGGTLPPAQAFPATGQTTCWDSGGSVIACGGTGHDGDTLAGAPLAYQDNGDGTITDLNTGLMWEKLSDDGSIHDLDNLYSWDDAFAVKVATLNDPNDAFAGHTDWRVPNRRELDSIVNLEVFSPSVSPAFDTGCAPACTVLDCSCTESSNHWSSSSVASNPDTAWNMGFSNGLVFINGMNNFFHVRAVRGP